MLGGAGNILGYLEPAPINHGTHAQYPYLGKDDDLSNCADAGAKVAVAIADNRRRQDLFDEIKSAGREVLTVVHPTAVIMPSSRLGPGCIVAPNAVVATQAVVGNGVMINYGALVGHDVSVGDFCFIAPGAQLLNNVRIGKQAVIGANAVLMPGVMIGDGAKIAANVTVHNDIPASTTVMAIPNTRQLTLGRE